MSYDRWKLRSDMDDRPDDPDDEPQAEIDMLYDAKRRLEAEAADLRQQVSDIAEQRDDLERQLHSAIEQGRIEAAELARLESSLAAAREGSATEIGGYRAAEVAELLDMLARSADQLQMSYTETAHLARLGAKHLRALLASLPAPQEESE
jgi:cell division septum initiation protein DivIVA